MAQPVNWQMVWVYSSSVWAIIGPLAGIYIGASIANRNEHKHWIADNRKQEFHDLLCAINQGFTRIAAFSASKPFFRDDNYQRELLLAETSTAGKIGDSIAIATEVANLRVMERWTTAASRFAETQDSQAFISEINKLTNDIRQLAAREFDSR